jgi:orotate phosphoribosyltransferase
MEFMLSDPAVRNQLLAFLRTKSVFYGNFLLSSGARSTYYIDCRLTTLDPQGAWLVGQVMHSLIKQEASRRNTRIVSVGGLTMGADPISLATAMYSVFAKENPPWQTFVVRKAPKGHGQTKLIEGNFKAGDMVVVVDDVVTRGDSTLKAIDAVQKEGGKVAFVAALVDRQEGGRQKIEEAGHRFLCAFTRDELVQPQSKSSAPDFVPA